MRRKKHVDMEERPYICTYDDCDKRYSSICHLRRHEQTHLANFKCTEEENCRKIFKTKATLKKHIDNAHLKKNPKKYKCPDCGEEFNKHSWLKSHQFKHTGVPPCVCPVDGCEKKFIYPSRLKRHMKIHEGYKCTKENCKETFATWSLLRKHILVAHPKIYKCHYCEKEFTNSNNKKAHMEIHELDREVFLCPVPNCSKYYFMKRNLVHHIKSYHEKRPFVCTQEHCHKAFKTEADMNAHCASHDPKKRHRRKKKKKSKPSFAARLAGLAPKKWQLQLLAESKIEDKVEAPGDNGESPEDKDESLEDKVEGPEDKDETLAECTSESQGSQDKPGDHTTTGDKVISEQVCPDVQCLTDAESSYSEEDNVIDDGIQTMLNMIDERSKFCTESTVKTKTECITLTV